MNRETRLLLLASIALAFGLRLVLLGESDIWWDEGLAVWAARQSPAAIARWTAVDVHPPLYFWLLWGWLRLAGESEFAVRFLSAALGTLTVAATGTLTWAVVRGGARRRAGGDRPATLAPALAALFLATSRFHLWWSQEARMYVLGGLLVTLSLYLTWKLSKRVTPRRVVAYLLVTVAALWTLYLLAFLLVVEGLFWVARMAWSEARWRPLRDWAMLQLATLALFLPWLAYALPRMQRWSVQVDFDGALFARLYAVLLSVGASTDIDAVAPLALAVMALGATGLALAWRRPTWRPGLTLALLALLIPPLIVWLATTTPRAFGYSPKPEARYLLPYAPAFALLLGWATVALGGWLSGVGGSIARPSLIRPRQTSVGPTLVLTLAVLLLNGWSLRDYFATRLLTDDYRSVAATLYAHWQPGDGVVLHTDQPWPVFTYHWPGQWVGISHHAPVTETSAARVLSPAWAEHAGLWLVVNENALRLDADGIVPTWLARRAAAQREWRFGGRRLLFFARTPARAATIDALGPRAPQPAPTGITWEQPLRRYRPGTLAHLFVTTEIAPGAPPLALRLGDPAAPLAETTIAASPAPGPQRLQFDLLVPPDAPPGVQPWTLVQGGTAQRVGSATILAGAAPDSATVLPDSATLTHFTFGEPPLFTLVGYDLADRGLTAGETLHLTLYWRGERPISLPFKVFVHLLAPGEENRGQVDSEPMGGHRPTTGWRPGEIIADSYAVPLSPDAPPGRYTVALGLYDAATGARLGPIYDDAHILQQGERILLVEFDVTD